MVGDYKSKKSLNFLFLHLSLKKISYRIPLSTMRNLKNTYLVKTVFQVLD